ncbi:MAG: glycosyltransferase family 2 protein [archaeon]
MARMVEYLNPKSHAVQLATPEKQLIQIKANEKIILSDWYMTYCPKYLRVVRVIENGLTVSPKDIMPIKYSPERLKKGRNSKILKKQRLIESKSTKDQNKMPTAQQPTKIAKNISHRRKNNPVVGRRAKEASHKLFTQACQNNKYIISNNVGVGILSYNRLPALKRLINSIRLYSDLRKITVFVSDESNDKEIHKWLSKQTDIVTMINQPQLGIAGNSNRLLRCLSRFKYCLLLNDDVEILKNGWEQFYINAHYETNIYHFCYHQIGVYGAKRSNKITKFGKTRVETIHEKPHGAVLFYTNDAFNRVGYFDEKFGSYGIEHVDWSNRISMSGIQNPGFHDILGSQHYFKIHSDASSIPNKIRGQCLNKARQYFAKVKNNQNRIYLSPSEQTKVPSISVIIPIRNIGRQKSLNAVVYSIRGQLYPNVEIILAEQDKKNNIELKEMSPSRHFLAKNKYPSQPFTKSMAFNLGVSKASCDKIILHDADIIAPSHYGEKISDILDKYEGAHIGSKVLYMSKKSSESIVNKGVINKNHECERAVAYFEGGSLACTKAAYFKVGAFNEIFEGYGVEDCDFFWRLKDFAKFYNQRTEDFIHLWHGRTPGWEDYHRKNKRIADQINRKYQPAQYVSSLVAKMKKKYPNLFKQLNL